MTTVRWAVSATGTSSGRRQSAVLIPVPAAEPLVGPVRKQYDPVAIAGVPAHITLVVPWLAPEKISASDLEELDRLLAGVAAFDFDLTSVAWFGRRVLWLAPEPGEPFRRLTALVAERFETPPWEDEFEEVVPHLTVAHASDGEELDGVAAELAAALPIHCRAAEVWVMVADGRRWSILHRTPLH